MVATLEDKFQAAEEEKANAFVELGFLRKSMRKREGYSHSNGKEPMRLANPTPNQERSSKSLADDNSTANKRSPATTTETKPNSISATCFYF
jgi:hypothetical protein